MKAVKLLSVVFLSLFLTTTAHAKDVKFAYVELGSVFNSYQKTKDFDATLQKDSQAAQGQIDDMIKKIRDNQSKMALLKEDEKQKVQADIDKQKVGLLEFQKSKRAELSQKFEDMRKTIVLEIEKVVSDIAKKEGYTYILSDTAVMYADPEENITKKVLEALNAGYKK
jgi:outer membrane protein